MDRGEGLEKAKDPDAMQAMELAYRVTRRGFGGLDDFVRQTGWLARACRTTPPRPGVERLRPPGEHGLARRADQLAHGVDLYASLLPSLEPWSKKLGVALPRPL